MEPNVLRGSNLVAVKEVRVCSIDVTGLHAVPNKLESTIILPETKKRSTHATISDTSFVVGFIAFLKKLTTTALKRSFSAGYRLNTVYERVINQLFRTSYN